MVDGLLAWWGGGGLLGSHPGNQSDPALSYVDLVLNRRSLKISNQVKFGVRVILNTLLMIPKKEYILCVFWICSMGQNL